MKIKVPATYTINKYNQPEFVPAHEIEATEEQVEFSNKYFLN